MLQLQFGTFTNSVLATWNLYQFFNRLYSNNHCSLHAISFVQRIGYNFSLQDSKALQLVHGCKYSKKMLDTAENAVGISVLGAVLFSMFTQNKYL